MFIYNPLIDEAIAHFVGHWEMANEAARMRHELLAFRQRPAQELDPDAMQQHDLVLRQFHLVKYYVPGVQHTPEPWHQIGWVKPWGQTLSSPKLDADAFNGSERLASPHHHGLIGFQHVQNYAPVLGPDPGELIFVIRQGIALEDNDSLDLGGALLPSIDPAIYARLNAMAAEAFGADPLGDADMPHSLEAIADYVSGAHAILAAAAQANPDVVAYDEQLGGTYVNGARVDAAPKIDDLLPDVFEPKASPPLEELPESGKTLVLDGIDGTLALQAGGNMLVNLAILNNTGLLGGVIAVAGNVHRIDAIVQSNSFSDIDAASDAISGSVPKLTNSYNVASFTQIDMPGRTAPEGGDESVGPLNWRLSVVDGDLLFTQWLVQASFVYDNDVHVLSDTGAYSTFTSGANFAQNIVDFSDLGLYYDLILIGGHLYDANIIVQANVLLDDDVMTGAGYRGTADTGGNLLYNGAAISNLGAQTWQSGLPQHYLDALERVGSNRLDMPEGFSRDANFVGDPGLSVLLITGNVYDLHYIKQINVLGDADQVAIAEAALRDNTTADWQISTGSNALINVASIVDTDSLGDVAYVGGELYSDAILIQADLLSATDDTAPDPHALATEAIAFIGGEMTTTDDAYDHAAIVAPPPSSSGSLDVMHSVLA